METMTEKELLEIIKKLKQNVFTYLHQKNNNNNIDMWKDINKKLAEIIILLNENGITLN